MMKQLIVGVSLFAAACVGDGGETPPTDAEGSTDAAAAKACPPTTCGEAPVALELREWMNIPPNADGSWSLTAEQRTAALEYADRALAWMSCVETFR